jgi:hypothetical protein
MDEPTPAVAQSEGKEAPASSTIAHSWFRFLRFDLEGQPSLLTASATLISIAAAYLYFTGWVYAYFYYKDFGVTLVSLDMPLQYFFVYAYTPLATLWGVCVVLLMAGAVYLYAAKKVGTILLSSALILVFPILFFIARGVAHDLSIQRRSNPARKVRMLLKHPDAAAVNLDPVNPGVVHSLGREEFQLLFETKDRFIVFFQPARIEGALPEAYVLSIMRSDLVWSMVIIQ